jgi:tRNA dimethylallyltransferase
MTNKKTLLCIVGPTASGKTAIAIKLAQHYKTEIISADSRQFYKELSIGTAKPSPEELAAAPHHFINNKSISETYSAGDFEKEALQKINELFESHDIVILAGGSGMYVDVVCKGFDPLPKVEAGRREDIIERYKKEGISFLQDEIMSKDPDYYKIVDTQNPQRLMRALEVIYATGKPFSEFRKRNASPRNFNIITVGLHWEREALYERINRRVDQMIESGLEKEAKEFINYREQYALRTVGYYEFFDYFDGTQNFKTTVDLIKQHTRNFAKRQLTWFRKDVNIKWIDAGNENEIFAFVKSKSV